MINIINKKFIFLNTKLGSKYESDLRLKNDPILVFYNIYYII